VEEKHVTLTENTLRNSSVMNLYDFRYLPLALVSSILGLPDDWKIKRTTITRALPFLQSVSFDMFVSESKYFLFPVNKEVTTGKYFNPYFV